QRRLPPQDRQGLRPPGARAGPGPRERRTVMSDLHRIALVVNGKRHEAEVESRRLLVDFLREDLGLVGTHIGCEHGVCGTCTVLMSGQSVRSCLTFAVQADGAEVLTVEGLASDGHLHPIQEAFWDK